MFCPQCKAEYRPGFPRCADCGVELVASLPAEPEGEGGPYVEYEEVLRTYNAGDVAFVKSLLESENITHFVQGEHFGLVHPLLIQQRVMVEENQANRARKLLRDVDLAFLGVTTRHNEP